MPKRTHRLKPSKKSKYSASQLVGLGIFVFFIIATVLAVLSQNGIFDLRDFAKEEKANKPKIVCLGGLYLDRNEGKCKKRETGTTGNTTVSNSCTGECVTSGTCAAKGLTNTTGSCNKGICCSRGWTKLTPTPSNTGGGGVYDEVQPTLAPTPACTPKGSCIRNQGSSSLGCCTGSSSTLDSTCSSEAGVRCL